VSAGGQQRHLGTAAPLATSLPPTRLTPPPGALLESLCHEPAVSSIASAATTIANTSLVCAAHHQCSTRRPALHPLVPRQRSRRFPTSFCTPASNPAGASAHRCQLTSTSVPQPPLSNIRSSGATSGGPSSSRTHRRRNTTPSAPPSPRRPRGSYHHHRLVINRCRWARSLRLPHSTARHDNLICICCASPVQSTTAATTAPQCGRPHGSSQHDGAPH